VPAIATAISEANVAFASCDESGFAAVGGDGINLTGIGVVSKVIVA
jgi:hypothetical protein